MIIRMPKRRSMRRKFILFCALIILVILFDGWLTKNSDLDLDWAPAKSRNATTPMAARQKRLQQLRNLAVSKRKPKRSRPARPARLREPQPFGIERLLTGERSDLSREEAEVMLKVFEKATAEQTASWPASDEPAEGSETDTLVESAEQSTTATLVESAAQSTTPINLANYLVYNKKCKIPLANAFSDELLKVYTPSKFKSCTNESALFRLNFDAHQQAYQLHVNADLVPRLWPTVQQYRCNYREVVRDTKKNPDKISNITQRVYFHQNVTLPRNVSSIIAECHDEANEHQVLQEDAFPLVQVSGAPPLKHSGDKPQDRKPSVIMLGLDSMSSINFRRTMPRTLQFVRQPGWYEMQGYNKVRGNTLPNMMVILTGCRYYGIYEECKRCLDRIPWIWKEYKQAGYKTAFAEDIANESMFTLALPGFWKPPTDYYLRPMIVGIQGAMRIYMRFGFKYCIGRRLAISYVYAFCQQFVERHIVEQEQPAFGLFWSLTFTHDFYFAAASLDVQFMEYLLTLEEQQLFEKSIVILFADHGSHYGDLMEMSDGYLESRLPILHIYLPPWFRRTYPQYAKALRLNRNRLSSNYDLHHTLQHILQLNASTVEQLQNKTKCPTSQSLFHELPTERGCEDACIPEHFCTCSTFISEPCNVDLYMKAKMVVHHINKYLYRHKFSQQCQFMVLHDLDQCERKTYFETEGKESLYGNIGTYRLIFRTDPGNAKFQVTFHFNRETEKIEDLHVPDISRLNSYHNQSLCVTDRIAKKFCYCFDADQKLEPIEEAINF